jgi:hypothetical protein
MNPKRAATYVAAATLTFSVGFALARLPRRQERHSRPDAHPSKESADAGRAAPVKSPDAGTPLEEIRFPRAWSETVTSAGRVEVVESYFLTWKVKLNGREILSSGEEGSLPPGVLKHVRGRVPPFDDVIVLDQATGTCCEFGRFWFLGLRADGSYFLSEAIGDGFAHLPEVAAGRGGVRVTVRSGYGRHGVGPLRGGTWLLKGGRVIRQKSARRRRARAAGRGRGYTARTL